MKGRNLREVLVGWFRIWNIIRKDWSRMILIVPMDTYSYTRGTTSLIIWVERVDVHTRSTQTYLP